MNCHDFKDQLHEYVEGSLSPGDQQAAEAHLAQCAACRQSARQEQQIARFLFDRLHRDVQALNLQPEVRRKIMETPLAPADRLWSRWAWAAALVLAGVILSSRHFPAAPPAVSIEYSYQVPVHEFHNDGNHVLDTVVYETVVISESFPKTKYTKEPL